MNIGDVVSCPSQSSKGTGTVVGLQEIFGEKYAEVFFEKTLEKIRLPVFDLSSLKSPILKIKDSEFSPARLYMLRLLKDQIKAVLSQEKISSAANFKILPLPHQLLAVDFVLGQFKPRALIADEVGLGKTIEAALIYEELKARGIAKRILIIAPSGLCQQWQEEMQIKFSEDFVLYDRETVKSLKKLNGEMTNVWKLKNEVITSIDFIKPKKINEDLNERTIVNREWHNKHVYEAASEAGFDVVIFDEAHKLTKGMSGEETARYKAGKNLADTTPILLLLSATPHQGDSGKFLNLLNLVDPYLFYKGCELTPENVKKITVRNNKRAAVDFNGNRLFKKRITSLCVIERDSKEDELEVQLYEAVTEYVSKYYDMASREQNRTMMFLLLIYQRMVSSSSKAIHMALSNRMKALTSTKREDESENLASDNHGEIDVSSLDDLSTEEQLTMLEQFESSKSLAKKNESIQTEIEILSRCVNFAKKASTGRNDAKFRKLLEIIDEFIIRENKPDLKFIIFTEFIETQKYIRDSLNSLGYSTTIINGRMNIHEKIEAKRKFQKDAQFLISTDAGGEGINLQFCRVMINYDLPWNPMRLEQRIGRIDRIGQEHDVKIVNFQIADTVENRVRDVIETKLETVKKEFNDGEDKLADILSTLQDEFNFETFYIDALRKNEANEQQLEDIAEKMYLRAKEIIGNGELALPFSDFNVSSISKNDIERHSRLVKNLITFYLKANDRDIEEYKTKKNVYHFEDPLTSKPIQNVIFDQRSSLEHEDYELLTFTHSYVVNAMENLDTTLTGTTAAKIEVDENKFAGEKGFFFGFILSITNNLDKTKTYSIPIFIDSKGRYNNRISQYFNDVSNVSFAELITKDMPIPIDEALEKANNAANTKAESIFYDFKSEHESLISEIEERMNKYFQDKKESINRIPLDNIRVARLKDLEKDVNQHHEEMKRKRSLVPSLNCEQIAYMEFV